MVIQELNGLGCNCTRPAVMGFGRPPLSRRGLSGFDNDVLFARANRSNQLNGLGEVVNYDIIRVGGKDYSANQLLDKTVIAYQDTKLYKGTNSKTSTVIGTVKKGQPIGKVYSYLKASQSSDGKSWLMFDSSAGFFFVPNETVSNDTLKDQGTKTVAEEVKEEEAQKLKENSPIEYYVSKYAWKVGLFGVGAFIVYTVVKDAAKTAVNKATS